MNKTVKSVNKFSEKIDRFIYKHFFLRKKRAFVFNYVSQGLRNGSAFKELILSLTNQMNDKFLYASLIFDMAYLFAHVCFAWLDGSAIQS